MYIYIGNDFKAFARVVFLTFSHIVCTYVSFWTHTHTYKHTRMIRVCGLFPV